MRSDAEPYRRRCRVLVGCLFLWCGCGTQRADGRPWVRDVRFEGVKSVDVKQLARRLGVEKSGWLGLRRRYLDPFAVHVDRERIEAFYRARGFFEARTTAAEVLPAKGDPHAPEAVVVRFVVDEGPRTHIAKIDVDGVADLATGEALQAHVRDKLELGKPFDHRRYLAAKRELDDELQRSGHAWADVEGRVEVNRRARAAEIRLTADPGPEVRFGVVRVEGAERVSARRIALHTGLREGTRFDPEELETVRGRLFRS